MGAITEGVRRIVPGSYRAMIGASGTDYYTQSDLQSLAEYAKFRLFATEVAEGDEATAFDPLQLGFLSKLTAVQFIPAAIDYWGDQLISESTTGTNEVHSFPDRQSALQKLLDNLKKELAQEAPSIPGIQLRGASRPTVTYYDDGRGILVTKDPGDFPPEDHCDPLADIGLWGVATS